MKLILSHTSALEFWRSGAMLGSVSTPGSGRARGLMPASFSAAVSSVEIGDIQSRYSLSLPLHTLVSDRNQTDNRKNVLATHVWSDVSVQDGFFRVSSDMYVCAPELVFLQLASSMSMLELVKLGFELCGTYRTARDGVEYSREPLTTSADLLRAVSSHNRRPGANNAAKALKYIRDGSYSPRETAAAMLFGLPYRYGGASFGMPSMNHPVELCDEARRLIGQRTCKCDLYYPGKKLDLEYDSYEFHSGPTRMERDALRREALALEGITVLTVTNQQLVDQGMLNALIKLISKQTGKRFRPQVDEFLLRQSRLIKLVAF